MLFTVSFGPWAPDLANVPVQVAYPFGSQAVPCADCLNVYYADGTYKSLPNPTQQTGALSVQPAGALTALDPSGNTFLYVTSSPNIWVYTGSSWTALLTLTGVTGWALCEFGTSMYATPTIGNGGGTISPVLYTWTVGSTATPTQVSMAVNSFGNVIATVGQFVMIGDLNFFPSDPAASFITGNGVLTTFSATLGFLPVRRGTVTIFLNSVVVGTDNGNGVISGATLTAGSINYATGAISVTFASPPPSGATGLGGATYQQSFPNRLQWSGIGNGSYWPAPLTNAALAAQSGRNDLEADLGPIMAICGYPLYAIILQKQGLTRAVYQGGNVVFSWGTYDRKRGLIARKAYVQVGQTVYFLSNEGFMSTDGATTTPIGTASDNSAGIDKWFWSNVNSAALNAISAGFDAALRCVVFAIPTGSNTLPDTLLIYNPLSGYWTRASVSCSFVWTDSDGTRHRLGMFSQNVSGSYYYELLTATASSGYLESCDIAFTDGNTRVTTKVRPNIACTDTPTVTVGNRNTLKASVAYSASVAPDSFGGGFAGVIGQGLYTRARVTSGAAQAIHGATLNLESGGAV